MQKIRSVAACCVTIPLIIKINFLRIGGNFDSTMLNKILYVVDKIDMSL